jgi:ubiquinone/menaquinone biosynthesis C-methylase UbiE
MKLYDSSQKRIVFFKQSATPEFWDSQWLSYDVKEEILRGAKKKFIRNITEKYLQPPAKILEGGCGNGQYVYGLQQWGYEAYGIDYAPKTVELIHKLFPELNVQVGDVRELPFKDNYFDGYWSMGVIEHFYDGYELIAKEMSRVIRPQGYLFLSIPYMSPLRKLKAKFGLYQPFNSESADKENFYEYLMDYEKVAEALAPLGLTLVATYPYNGAKGLKSELEPLWLKKLAEKLLNARNPISRVLSKIVSVTFSQFSPHAIALVFQKQ